MSLIDRRAIHTPGANYTHAEIITPTGSAVAARNPHQRLVVFPGGADKGQAGWVC